MSRHDHAVERPRSLLALSLWGFFALLFFAAFVALGTWQVYRLGWKRDLIARVDARLHAPVTAAPAPAQWPQVNVAQDEYRRVRLEGHYLYDKQTYVWANADQGAGFWVVTPLQQADGAIVLVNRGFVLPEWCGRHDACVQGPAGETTVTGLLRISEPSVFLRRNEPAKDNWYTRDVPLIAKARGLTEVAPYFVDADAASAGVDHANWPQGGLTQVSFPNNHLSYLITWYVLALMTLAGVFYVGRGEYRLRRRLREAGRR